MVSGGALRNKDGLGSMGEHGIVRSRRWLLGLSGGGGEELYRAEA
jgi:hypothetical protein